MLVRRLGGGVSVMLVAVSLACGEGEEWAGNADYAPSAQCLPTVRLATEDGAPVDSREEYVAGRVRIDGMGESDPCALAEAPMKIKGRGNSTWGHPKKPYALKLDAKASVCGMPSAKSWVLLADYLDPTLLRNRLAFTLAERAGLEFTPRSRHVEVYLNERYLGVYLLTEKIQVGKGRVDIDVDDGAFLLEADDRSPHAPNRIATSQAQLLVEAPEDPSPEQLEPIRQWLQEAEEALFSDALATDPERGYATYLDVPSFAR